LFVCAALLFRCARVVRAGDCAELELSQVLQACRAPADGLDDAVRDARLDAVTRRPHFRPRRTHPK
jgi:hypothetical protein